MCGSDVFLAVLAVFFPPVSVWIKVGICTADSIINLALCCLGYVPGLIHAWYIICKYPEPDYDDPSYQPIADQGDDVEHGRVTYYYVSHQPYQHNPSLRAYGTVGSQASQPGPAANSTKSSAPKQQREYRDEPASGDGGGSSQGYAPPTYAEAVRGDNKVQTQD